MNNKLRFWMSTLE